MTRAGRLPLPWLLVIFVAASCVAQPRHGQASDSSGPNAFPTLHARQAAAVAKRPPVPRHSLMPRQVDACAPNLRPPFDFPLQWRTAYGGSNGQYYDCPSWSTFGPVRPNGKWHKGIDLFAPTGVLVRAAVDGSVSYGRDPNGWGLYARVRFDQKVRAQDGTCATTRPMEFIYAHLMDDDRRLETGREEPVRRGDIVGRVGCSGNAGKMCSPSPESHIHITLRESDGKRRKIDPLSVADWWIRTPFAAEFVPPLRACPIRERNMHAMAP